MIARTMIAVSLCGLAAAATAKPVDRVSPSGITIQAVPKTYPGQSRRRGDFLPVVDLGTDSVYADARGFLLYYSDGADCNEECKSKFSPAKAPRRIEAAVGWSTVKTSGEYQWALRGKPLYLCADNKAPGDMQCLQEKGWRPALVEENMRLPTPPEFKVAELPAAFGFALTDKNGLSLYIADPKQRVTQPRTECPQGTCRSSWTPVVAAELAIPIGEFTIVSHTGVPRQWAFRGAALYRYSGDLEPGDINGLAAADSDYQLAYVAREFAPKGIGVLRAPGTGDILVDSNKRTLYRMTAHGHSVTGHGLPRSIPLMPTIGRALGTKFCDEACRKMWRPLEAPRRAVAAGYWSVVTREDGTKQWAYKSYPLYTYANDVRPGDILGHQHIDIRINPDATQIADLPIGTPWANGDALYWVYMEP